MKNSLVRFGVAVDSELLADFDELVAERGCTRSELFRDLARAEVNRARAAKGGHAVATLTLVYDHHVRELTEKLTELQHQLGEVVRCAMHLHLSHDECLEVVVLSGHADELRAVADRISATRGVKHGHVDIIPHAYGASSHHHEHIHEHEHVHEHGPDERRAERARTGRPRVEAPKKKRTQRKQA